MMILRFGNKGCVPWSVFLQRAGERLQSEGGEGLGRGAQRGVHHQATGVEADCVLLRLPAANHRR